MVWIALRRAVTELRSLLKNAIIESGTSESDQIKSAVSDALDETLSLFDEAIMPNKNASDQTGLPSQETPPPPPMPEPSPLPKRRIHRPATEEVPASQPYTQVRRPKRARMVKVGDIFSPRPESDAVKPAAKPLPVPESNKDFPWTTFEADQPTEKPASEKPTAPKVSPDILNDPNHVLTYDEARALGLIDLDQSKDEQVDQ